MKEAVVTICGKDLDKFEGQSIGSTSWFNLDREFLKKFSTLEPDFYEKLFERGIAGQDIEPYKMFVVPFDTNKLNRLMRNEPVTTNEEGKIASCDEEEPKDSESSSDDKK